MNKLKVAVAATFLGGLCMMSTSVLGASNPSIKVQSNKETIRAGDEVIFSFVMNGVEQEGCHIESWNGYIQYDSVVFEEVKESDVKLLNFFNGVTYQNSNHKIEGDKVRTIQNGTELWKIKLRVKDSVGLSSTSVSMRNVKLKTTEGSYIGISNITKLGVNVDRQIPTQGALTAKNNTDTTNTLNTNDLSNTLSSTVEDLVKASQSFKVVTPTGIFSAAGGLIMVFVQATLIVLVIRCIAKYLVKGWMGVHRRSKVVGLSATVKRLSRYTPRESTYEVD